MKSNQLSKEFEKYLGEFRAELAALIAQMESAKTIDELTKIRTALRSLLAKIRVKSTKDLVKLVALNYHEGLAVADKALAISLGNAIKTSFNKPHKEAIKLLSDMTTGDFSRAMSSFDGSISSYFSKLKLTLQQKKAFNAILKDKQFTDGGSVKVVTDTTVRLLRKELSAGTVITGARRMTVENYAELIVRTVGRAAVSRAMELRCLQNQISHVKISTHNTQCSICGPHEGKIYSIIPDDQYGYPWIGNIRNSGTPFHPHCAHVETPFIVGLSKE